MNSERIKALASFIQKDNSVVDVGCDHGYLSIYLKKNKLCKNVIASDISQNALSSAINNFKKYNLNIKYYVTDGLNNIEDYYDTVVIAGMGTHTIINILKDKELPKKIILASNNDHYLLRKFMQDIGYILIKEVVVFENKKYYPLMHYEKGIKKEKKRTLMYGKSNNIEYFDYLITKNNQIINKVPLKEKIKLRYKNYILKKIIRSTEKK